MPYYNAGDYYQGDYYQAGGLFGSIGKFLGGVAKKALGLSPVGRAVSIGSSLIPTFSRSPSPTMPPMQIPEPGITGAAHRFFPGGHTGFGYYNKKGEFIEGKRPRMNPLNIRALRRAMRRAKGFERQARRVGSFFHPGKTYRLKGRGRKRAG